MRRGAGEHAGDDLDLVFEANRIIENSLPHTARRTAKSTGPSPAVTVPQPAHAIPGRRRTDRTDGGPGLLAGLVWFFGGFLSGGGLIGLLWWIL